MQPCSHPRYGFTDRSKPMSGDALKVRIVLGFSIVTVVRSGGGAPSIAARASSQSPSSCVCGRLKRVLSRLRVAPRTARCLIAIDKGIARDTEHIKNDYGRSEEHTSELQSLMRISYAVFCLKKKKNIHQQTKNK